MTSATRKATLAAFAGTWIGHTRALTITRSGVAKESIGSGCCDPVIDLMLRLSHARGTTQDATVTARVTAVQVHDKRAFSNANPAPHVGEVGRLRLKDGVITELLTNTTYCDTTAGGKGVCGA